MSLNLQITETAPNQNQIHVTVNDGFNDVDAALTENLEVEVTNTNTKTLLPLEFTRNYRFVIVPGTPAPTGDISLVTPVLKRGLFLVQNNTAEDVLVNVFGGLFPAVTVEPTEIVLCYCDAEKILALSSTNATPGGGGVVLKLNDATVGSATALDFKPSTGVIITTTDETGGEYAINVQSDVAFHRQGSYLTVDPSSASATAYTYSLSPALLTYLTGMVIHFIPDVDNGANPTLSLNGLAAIPIRQPDGITPLGVGRLQAGELYFLWFDGAYFRLIATAEDGSSTTVEVFTDLLDAPADYSGQANKVVAVKGDETGLEFVDSASGSSFLALSDTPASYSSQANKLVAVNGAASGLEFITAPSGGTFNDLIPLAKVHLIDDITSFSSVVNEYLTSGTVQHNFYTYQVPKFSGFFTFQSNAGALCRLVHGLRVPHFFSGGSGESHILPVKLGFVFRTPASIAGTKLGIYWGMNAVGNFQQLNHSLNLYYDPTQEKWRLSQYPSSPTPNFDDILTSTGILVADSIYTVILTVIANNHVEWSIQRDGTAAITGSKTGTTMTTSNATAVNAGIWFNGDPGGGNQFMHVDKIVISNQ